MPRVHPGGVVLQASRRTPFGRYDPQLAIRAQQHVIAGLGEDDPLPVRRVLGEIVAHPVRRSSRERRGYTAAALVEGDAVDVVAKGLPVPGKLAHIVEVEKSLLFAVEVLRQVGIGASKEDLAAVGTPRGVGLHVLRVVRAGKREELVFLPVIDNQDSLDGKEQLRDHQVVASDKDRSILHGADDIATVGGNLRQQAKGHFTVLATVVGPGNDLLVVHYHLLLDRKNSVSPLVVAVIHVESQDAAVRSERMAIAADRQIRQDDGRPFLHVDGAVAPPDPGRILHRLEKGEGDFAIEQGVLHRVGGCPE